jgi:hypothetical protein
MRTSTHTVVLEAPKTKAFNFLSRIENLPKWATMFCKELRRDESGKYKVLTPQGEIFFRMASDSASGVIDMYGGPSEESMAHWPTRIIPLGEKRSLFIFTALQYPGISDETFVQQCKGLESEFPHIQANVEGR